MQACTIVARNYLPYARVFAQSLTAVHPQAHVTVLVIDGAAEPSDAGLFRTLRLEDVIPDAAERRRQTFLYDVTELSTAVKPLLLQRLLAEGADSVLYFDPDIQVFDSVDNLSRLAADRGIVLTPHMLSPIPDDGFEVSDLAVLRAGVFNLGFIGVGAGTERFLEWWSGRLRRHLHLGPRQRHVRRSALARLRRRLVSACARRRPWLQRRLLESARAPGGAHGERLRRQRASASLLPLQRIRSGGPVPPQPLSGPQPARAAQRAAGAARAVRRVRGEAADRRTLSRRRELRLLDACGRHADRFGRCGGCTGGPCWMPSVWGCSLRRIHTRGTTWCSG